MRRRASRGSVSVEAALLTPVFVLVMAMATAGWRVWWASAQVQAAAEAGARVAAQAVDVNVARGQVSAVVSADLVTAGLRCDGVVIQDDLAAVVLPAGVPGTVSVGVTCAVELRDLLVPGLPGAITVRASATESIDVFRSRQR